jgi:hypothetical protein
MLSFEQQNNTSIKIINNEYPGYILLIISIFRKRNIFISIFSKEILVYFKKAIPATSLESTVPS